MVVTSYDRDIKATTSTQIHCVNGFLYFSFDKFSILLNIKYSLLLVMRLQTLDKKFRETFPMYIVPLSRLSWGNEKCMYVISTKLTSNIYQDGTSRWDNLILGTYLHKRHARQWHTWRSSRSECQTSPNSLAMDFTSFSAYVVQLITQLPL